ncbi:MAG: UDP-glucuronic acid dehydrogenase [Pseudomonadota bacterium]|nr:UDP-glucuronic acid dehydrogenase [Pseudomonadota bacterium]
MKITILNSSSEHPINEWIKLWITKHKKSHEIRLIRTRDELVGGEILFLISCSELVTAQDRAKFKKTLVIHASDLPLGRGWSPHIWDILSGKEFITLALLEAEDEVDSGDVWKKVKVRVPLLALYDEINQIIFDAEMALMDYALDNFEQILPEKQIDMEPTYWPKRKPSDSEIDINKSINEQFNLLRVCDPQRFPAFFYKNGKKFNIKIEAVDE